LDGDRGENMIALFEEDNNVKKYGLKVKTLAERLILQAVTEETGLAMAVEGNWTAA
jgi:hypothetical protein